MNRTASLLAAALVFSCGCSRGAPQAPALSPGDEAAWNHVVAALQQVSEEYREALELKDPPVVERRLSQLATLLDEASALLARIGTPRAADVDAQVKGIRRRIAAIDYRLGEDTRAIVDRILQVIPVRRGAGKKPRSGEGERPFAGGLAGFSRPRGGGPAAGARTGRG